MSTIKPPSPRQERKSVSDFAALLQMAQMMEERAATHRKEAAKKALRNLAEATKVAAIELFRADPDEDREKAALRATQFVAGITGKVARGTGEKLIAKVRLRKLEKAISDAQNYKAGNDNKEDGERSDQAAVAENLFKNFVGAFGGALGDFLIHKTKKEEIQDGGKEIVHPWERKKLLGEGAFGKVYHAVDKAGFEFAVKEVNKSGVEEKCLREEISCLLRLAHGNIVRCYGCAEGKEKIFMYMELMQGSIRDVMNKTEKPLSIAHAQKYTIDLLQGLVYLHKKGIIHRDIKCGNLLLNAQDTVKLADMGISKKHNEETMVDADEEKAGTWFWMSPEVLTGKMGGRRSDVWSVGCTVYEMIRFKPPFASGMLAPLFAMMLPLHALNMEHRALVGKDKELGGDIQDFLLKIFVPIEDRPFAEDVAKHPWLQHKKATATK